MHDHLDSIALCITSVVLPFDTWKKKQLSNKQKSGRMKNKMGLNFECLFWIISTANACNFYIRCSMFRCAALFFSLFTTEFSNFCVSPSCCYSVIVIILHWLSSISESSGKFHISICFVCLFNILVFFLSFSIHYFLYWNEMKCLPNQIMPKAKDNDRFMWFLRHFTNDGLVCIAHCRLLVQYFS